MAPLAGPAPAPGLAANGVVVLALGLAAATAAKLGQLAVTSAALSEAA